MSCKITKKLGDKFIHKNHLYVAVYKRQSPGLSNNCKGCYANKNLLCSEFPQGCGGTINTSNSFKPNPDSYIWIEYKPILRLRP